MFAKQVDFEVQTHQSTTLQTWGWPDLLCLLLLDSDDYCEIISFSKAIELWNAINFFFLSSKHFRTFTNNFMLAHTIHFILCTIFCTLNLKSRTWIEKNRTVFTFRSFFNFLLFSSLWYTSWSGWNSLAFRDILLNICSCFSWLDLLLLFHFCYDFCWFAQRRKWKLLK